MDIVVPPDIETAIQNIPEHSRGVALYDGELDDPYAPPYTPPVLLDADSGSTERWFTLIWYAQSLAFRMAAVAILRDYYSKQALADVVVKWTVDGTNFINAAHFSGGMHCRNVLRSYGLTDRYCATACWDDYWACALLEAANVVLPYSDEFESSEFQEQLTRLQQWRVHDENDPVNSGAGIHVDEQRLSWDQRLRNFLAYKLRIGRRDPTRYDRDRD